MTVGLVIIFIIVLFFPLTFPVIERNLEVFLFFMGVAASLIGGELNRELFLKASQAPIKIAIAVSMAGILFRWFHKPLEKLIKGTCKIVPFRVFVALSVLTLGLVSSVITAIIAALVLVVIVKSIELDRRSEIRFVVIACFSIGLGAALTPIGEPLATIVVSKLDQHFLYLIQLIGPEVFAGIFMFAILASIMIHPPKYKEYNSDEYKKESYEEIVVRALKIYFFVMGLEFLGDGFEPLINKYFLNLEPAFLYWINMISAVLDNATLSAAEIGRHMGAETLKAILLGLLISGGMLIPGNIPNIISAGKLRITSGEWAKLGVPIGLIVMMVFYFTIFQ